MIKINRMFVEKTRAANSLEDLHELLQKAIELEHATIPPYLTAMFSLKHPANKQTREIIHSVVTEEMLHMALACNILNALGGQPLLNKPGFIPVYPTPLPMGITGQLVIGLERYSKDLVKRIFMEIEEPENPLLFPETGSSSLDATGNITFDTIGQFYLTIKEKIIQLADEHLPGDPNRQVGNFINSSSLFPIFTREDASRAIDIIVEQGEGTTTSPTDKAGELAHYYRFNELFVGKKLVRDAGYPQGFSFSGDEIPFDEDDVYPLAPNCKSTDLPPNSEEQKQSLLFNLTYSKLLNGLHRGFNAEPGFIEHTLGTMYDLKLCGEKLASMKFPGRPGFNIGPSFEYIPLSG